jgi:hypothetical protein
MNGDQSKLDLCVFGVQPGDPGYIYIIEDRGRYKIGRTRNSAARVRVARTWLPDMTLVAHKPFWNVSRIERSLHIGFSQFWYHGEWFQFPMEEDRDLLLEGFLEFSDTDRDRNSVNFVYWFNGDGMSEFLYEHERQGLTLPQFQRQESASKKV